MVKTNIKEKKAAKLAAEKQADVKLYRLMVQFALSMLALFLTLTVKNNEIYILYKIMPIFLVVSGVLFGLSALNFSLKRIKGADETSRVINSTGLFGNAAALLALSGGYYLFMEAELVIGAIIALTVAYIAYNVNGEGFFAFSVLTAASYIAFTLAGCTPYGSIAAIISNGAFVLSFAVPVFAVILAILMLAKKNGVRIAGIKASGKLVAVAMLLTALVALVAASVALVYFAAAELIMYGMLALYFVATVIGVFKMM